jgi:hypothetical protein
MIDPQMESHGGPESSSESGPQAAASPAHPPGPAQPAPDAALAPPAPELDLAAKRLSAAVERLEARLDGLFERLESQRPYEREAQALRMDRARLAGDLDAARARERELQKLADEASEALGAAISEVREALGKV